MKDEKKARLKRQLISGGIYIALAAAVVGVTTSTVAKLMSDTGIESIPEQTKYGGDSGAQAEMPNVPEIPEIPDISEYEVSGTADGVSSEIVPGDTPESENVSINTEAAESEPQTENTVNTDNMGNTDNIAQTETTAEGVQDEPDYGYPGYVKPCEGYILREYSSDALVYSPTMYDYRIHEGTDIAAEVGTPIKAVAGGKVTDISEDDMYGMTVTIESPDGLTLRYCNLSESALQGVEVGAVVQTGAVIGGVGETALCESAEAPHLHIEAMRGGSRIDPEDLFEEFYSSEATVALTSTEID